MQGNAALCTAGATLRKCEHKTRDVTAALSAASFARLSALRSERAGITRPEQACTCARTAAADPPPPRLGRLLAGLQGVEVELA
eukprot:CAMPEP_0179237218 /NCGR_PEP_ID=MMETSP0797-20121207/14327_1 /TAXON_ID=47934 /ORGANISM="Dinophysis acuminata, Strain DAEP01" /LENGTH=83 /DNA_ID=CAMNT_0020944493 /DNA_START=27 /DNA_END=274 /DNA_ORIENTATION=+